MEKILNKIKELQEKFEALKSKNHQEGQNEYYSLTQFLERAIDRIYPEKDAKSLKSQLYHIAYVARQRTESEKQEEYIEDIDMALRVVNTILEEAEVFGFDDFKPVKEKIETEFGVNQGKFSLFRKNTKEK
jgi:hypothetical protein